MENQTHPVQKSGDSASKATSPSNGPLKAVDTRSSPRPVGGETLGRATEGAHRAVDATAAKVAPVVDAVHDKVEAARNAVSNTQEWVGAAREAIQARPFAAIAGAAIIGAAYMSLRRR